MLIELSSSGTEIKTYISQNWKVRAYKSESLKEILFIFGDKLTEFRLSMNKGEYEKFIKTLKELE